MGIVDGKPIPQLRQAKVTFYSKSASLTKGKNMNKVLIGGLAFAGVLVIFAIGLLISYVSYNNTETRLRNQINATQENNKNVYDNAVKTIQQNAEVTAEQAKAVQGILTSYATARGGSSGKVASMLTEAIPNLDTTSQTFINLQNILTAARGKFEQNQKQLLDLKREHDNTLTVFPSSFFTGLAGKQPIDVTIVTSTRTEAAFQTGIDDDTKVFR